MSEVPLSEREGGHVLYRGTSEVYQPERLVIYCQTSSVSAAHATHCATYCTPRRPLLRSFSGWILTPPPTVYQASSHHRRNPQDPPLLDTVWSLNPVFKPKGLLLVSVGSGRISDRPLPSEEGET